MLILKYVTYHGLPACVFEISNVKFDILIRAFSQLKIRVYPCPSVVKISPRGWQSLDAIPTTA